MTRPCLGCYAKIAFDLPISILSSPGPAHLPFNYGATTMYMKIRGLGVASGRLQAITVAAFLLGVSSGCAVAEDAIRVGVGVDPSFTSWWVAADRGFFTKRNLKVAITQFSGGPDLADATMAGEQDFGSSGTATWMPRFVRSDSLRILCTMATSPDNFKMAALTSIKSLSDLKGKKVGTVSGSSTDYLWALVTKKLGIPGKRPRCHGSDPAGACPSAGPRRRPGLLLVGAMADKGGRDCREG